MKITELKINPRNPQKFTDEAIETLMKSIKTFPKMLTLRPIVYDPKTMYVLGGNKRLICLQKLGYKEIPDSWVKSADELTEDEKKRFTVQDNIQSGTFDFEILDEDFEQEELEEWGVEIQNEIEEFDFEKEFNEIKDDDVKYPIVPRFYEKYDAFVIYTNNEIDANFLKELLKLGKEKSEKNNDIGQTFVLTFEKFKKIWESAK